MGQTLTNPPSSLPQLPPRPIDGHKGLFGRILVVGGHDEMIGAPVLAATAALRMGGGLVQIAVPAAILPAAISITPELIGLALNRPGSDRKLLDAAQLADALVIGPGLGQSPQARRRLMRLIRLNQPMVIDADALNILAAEKCWPKSFTARAVLTPHPGEMRRLGKLLKLDTIPTDPLGRVRVAVAAAKAFKQVIVLKGHRTVVTDGSRIYVNSTGDSSLAKAGTGDVLSGILATLLAQRMDRFDAACLATHLHGRAGEIASHQLDPRSVLAGEVILALPAAIREYAQKNNPT